MVGALVASAFLAPACTDDSPVDGPAVLATLGVIDDAELGQEHEIAVPDDGVVLTRVEGREIHLGDDDATTKVTPETRTVVLEWASNICHKQPVVTVEPSTELITFRLDRGPGRPRECDSAKVSWRFLVRLHEPVGNRSLQYVVD